METKDIYCKFTYKCGICGKEFNNVPERANCEIECSRKAEEEARKAAEAKKKEEQKARKEEADNAFKVIAEYIKDYGHYEYSDGGEDTNFHWPSRVWHRFW